jgi:hypothetical protein
MKRTVKERRQRNRELAEMDKRNRCGVCKRPIGLRALHFADNRAVRFCSWGCRETAIEREAEARR